MAESWKPVADDDGVEQIGNDDQHRCEISQAADGAGQPRQPKLQGAFAGFLLHLPGHIAIERGVAHVYHPHDPIAGGYRAAMEQLVLVG